MINVNKRNNNWEAYHNGALLEYSEDLKDLFHRLKFHAADIEAEELEDQFICDCDNPEPDNNPEPNSRCKNCGHYIE